MLSIYKSKMARTFVIVGALSLVVASTGIANAASKTITCYKGTASKKVTAAAPKCAAGWSTTKPKPAAPKPVASRSSAPAASDSTVALNATYKGKIAMVWTSSDVAATVTATGTGTTGGLDSMVGTGSSSPASQCDAISGSGTLSGSGGTLKITSDASAKGCAADAAAPTAVTITGNATITGGTGKYAGATGTLKVTGSFAVNSTEAGSKDSTALTITLTGNIVTK